VTSVGGVRHPEHDAVSQELHGWYNAAVPEIGLDGTAHWFGFTCLTGPGRARLVLSIGDPAQVPGALAAARDACPAGSYLVMVDDRERAARLGPALRQHGCEYQEFTTFLALAGPLASPAPGPGNLEITAIGPGELETWARVKLQSFGGTEDPPSPESLEAEIAARRAEQPLSEYQLARLGGQPVAVLAHYPGAETSCSSWAPARPTATAASPRPCSPAGPPPAPPPPAPFSSTPATAAPPPRSTAASASPTRSTGTAATSSAANPRDAAR